MRLARLDLLRRTGSDSPLLLAPKHHSPAVEKASADLSTRFEDLMHEDSHLRLGLGLHQRQREAFLTDGHRIARKRTNLLDGEDEGGRDRRSPVRRFDDNEGEVFGRVVDETKEAVRTRQLQRLLLDIELLLDLVAH
jgi:hypothetical protein